MGQAPACRAGTAAGTARMAKHHCCWVARLAVISPPHYLLPPVRRPAPAGDWAAVFDTQQAAAADAEVLAAERRAAMAAQAAAARAAGAPGGGQPLEPVLHLPMPPGWQFMQMPGMFPGQMPGPMMMMDEFDVSWARAVVGRGLGGGLLAVVAAGVWAVEVRLRP